MKKILLASVGVAFTFLAGAQVNKVVPKQSQNHINGGAKQVATGQHAKSTQAVQSFWVDYVVADFNNLFFNTSIKTNYTDADSDLVAVPPVQSVAVSLGNPLSGYSDYADVDNSLVEYPYYFGAITIDSIITNVYHRNTSATMNKMRIKILKAATVTYNDGQGNSYSVLQPAITGKQTYWSHEDSTTTSWSNSGEYLRKVWAPAYSVPNNQKVAVALEFDGSITQDTFYITGGGVSGNPQGSDPTIDQVSQYPFSSTLALNLDPTDYYPNQFISFVDGSFYIQNWDIFMYVTYNVTGVSENEFIKGVKIGQSFPNPADKATRFFYELQKPTNVTFSVYDMNGRLVKEYNEGVKEAGKHTHIIDLASFNSGVYFYTIKTDATTITKRFVVTK